MRGPVSCVVCSLWFFFTRHTKLFYQNYEKMLMRQINLALKLINNSLELGKMNFKWPAGRTLIKFHTQMGESKHNLSKQLRVNWRL